MRLVLSIIFLLTTVNAYAVTDISTCQTFSTFSTSYRLTANVSSNATCFTVTAQKVKLDLNTKTVTYDNQAPITIPNGSFESATMTDWDLTNAPQAARALGTYTGTTVSTYDGDYAIRFTLPAADQHFLTAADVTLEANTTYSLSAMFRNSGNNDTTSPSTVLRDPITMTVSIDGTAYTATKTGITWRGFEYTNIVFTTGGSPVSGKIRIALANASNASLTGYAYVDDIRVLKANSYGLNAGPSYANARYFQVYNGTITQGQGNGFASHAINMSESAGVGYSINNIVFTTQGVNSRPITGYYFNNSTINNNTFNHNTKTIRSRDNYDGATIYLAYASSVGSYSSTIHTNTFSTSPQTAIYATQTTGQPKNEIYDNNITIQSLYTNDFAITASGTKIHDNIVNCGSGLNSCRGIAINGVGTEVYNNTVTVQQLARNQEYNGCEAYGAYGMQMEYTASGVEIYGNTVTANAEDCEAHALRLNPDPVSTNNLIHNNSFIALRSGTARATSLKSSELNSTSANIYSNTFTTNHRWIYVDQDGSVSSITANLNTWTTSGTLPSPFYPFEVASGQHFTGNITNNSYGAGDEARFENEFFRVAAGTQDLLSTLYVDGVATSDTIAPVTTFNSSLKISTRTTITFTCIDNVACTSTKWCADDTNACTPTGTGVATVRPNQYLRYYSVDAIPNTETTKSSFFTWPTRCN